MEDDDLYDMALGENYNCSAPSTSEPTTKTTEKVKEEPEKPPSSAPDYAALFRELLVGSRAQIAELSKENERLQKNLENAISSGGVVICPNCTHHFKDRQCALRPRTMKKMRARNCVELEFHTEEDLETWLYLNQLETNNDGLPTIFRVKKDDASAQKKSLRDVGSLLPKKLEDVKTTSKVRLEIVKKKDDDRKKVVSQATREKSKSEDVRRKDTRDTKKKETPRKIETEDVRRNGRAKFDSSRKPDPKTVKRKLSASANSEDVKDRKSSRKEPSKPLSERLAFPQRDEPRKRAPIVWGDDDEETVPKVQNNSGQFSFKITAKTAKKEPVKQPQKPALDVKNSGGAGSKFKFVPTFSKPCSKSSDPREVQSTSSGVSSKTTDESKILEDSTVTSSAACDIWHLFPIKKSPQVLQHVQNHAQRRQIEGRRTINETIVVDSTNPPPPSVLTLENLGVSHEGMEILRRLKGPGAVETQTSGETSAPPTDGPAPAPAPPPEQNTIVYADDDDDLLKEFFPTYQRTTSNRQESQELSDSDTGSITSVTDQEEDELLGLVREDSAAPPDGDGEEDFEKTMIGDGGGEEEEEDDFCLEDVEDDVDDLLLRERKLSEMSEESEANQNEWMADMEQGADDVIEMKSEFRLSDDDDVISPVTSTPKPEYGDVELEEEEEEEDEEDFTLKLREDSFVGEELDWNYGTEDEEEKEKEQEEGILEGNEDLETLNAKVEPTTAENEVPMLEDGEISDDDTEKRPSMRDRIKFVVDEKQITGEEDDGFEAREAPRKSGRRRRSSEENRPKPSYRKPPRHHHQSGLLKRRNS